MRKLTARQEAFSVGVAKGLSLTDAYRASYDVKPGRKAANVGKEASQLAKLPHVAARVTALKKRVRAKVKKLLVEEAVPSDAAAEPVLQQTAINPAAVVLENAKIGLSDIRRVLTPAGSIKDPSEWGDDAALAVAGYEVRVTTHRDKNGAVEETVTCRIELRDSGPRRP